MRLTTKGRFAVTAMIDLALRQGKGPVTLSGISQRQAISLSYLEQLFGKLRRHELVESTRGPGGGYTLGRKAADITVADIIVSVDEPIDATQCAGKENCHGDGGRCMTHELWSQLNQRMVEFLDSVAPEVQTISRGSAPISSATSWRAFSTASSASQPHAWLREAGLPKCSRSQGTIASTTRGSTGVVAP